MNYVLFHSLLLTHISMLCIPGSLDRSFGGKHNAPQGFTFVSTTSIEDNGDELEAVIMQPNRKIIAAGTALARQGFAVARFNPDGTLDNSFGNGGIIIEDLMIEASPRSIMLQNNGKILVPFSEGATGNEFLIFRFTSIGKLDATWAKSGKVETSFDGFFNVDARSVQVLCDDSVLLAGSGENAVANREVKIVKYTKNGSIDESFALDGIFSYTLNDAVQQRIVVQKDNKIVLATLTGDGTTPRNISLMRLLANGSFDTSFNPTGEVSGVPGIVRFDSLDSLAQLGGLVIQRDGKILVVTRSSDNDDPIYVIRFNADGSIDSTYNDIGMIPGVAEIVGRTGKQTILRVQNCALQVDNKLCVCFSAVDADDSNVEYIGLARLNSGGTLDKNFGGFSNNNLGTVVLEKIVKNQTESEPFALTLQADGKIIIVGEINDQNGAATFEDGFVSRFESGVMVSKVAQSIFGKYALTSDMNRLKCI